MALQALSEVAQKIQGSQINLFISASIDDIFKQDFIVNRNNKLVLQRSEIPSNLLPTSLLLNATGQGCALFQVNIYVILLDCRSCAVETFGVLAGFSLLHYLF